MSKPGMGKYQMSSWVYRVSHLPFEQAKAAAEETLADMATRLIEQPERSRLWQKYIREANEILASIGAIRSQEEGKDGQGKRGAVLAGCG